jgi:hypothetical protein
MFLRHDLDELLAFDKSPAISIYLPTHPVGREVRQDAIRLRQGGNVTLVDRTQLPPTGPAAAILRH